MSGLRNCAYHLCHHLLHKLGAFFNFGSRSPQLNNVTLLGWVREIDDDLKQIRGIKYDI